MIPTKPNSIVSTQVTALGKAVEKALATHVEKHGHIMTDTFELHESYTKGTPYNLHFIYVDPETRNKAVRIFYNLPLNPETNAFTEKMQEIKAWIVMLGVLRKPKVETQGTQTGRLSAQHLRNAAAMLDKQNVPTAGRRVAMTGNQLNSLVGKKK